MGAVALLCALGAMAWFMQGPSENANSHYALVRAIAAGTPIVDKTRFEVGDLSTVDISYLDGHYYSQKAPGLAVASLPAFAALSVAGAAVPGDPTHALWFLGFLAIIAPAGVALASLRRVADRTEAPFGALAAVTIALGTFVLPFAGLYHAHVLSAALGFVAFAVLRTATDSRRPVLLTFIAGIVAGAAVTTEYTLVLVAAVLAAYAARHPPRLRRLAAYAAGGAIGVAPLIAYNAWAFGKVTGISYEGAVKVSGVAQEGDVVNDIWSSFFNAPDMQALASALFLPWGFVTGAPVVAAAVVGVVALRRRAPAEALVVGAVVAAFLLFFLVFYVPSPRYLIPMLPFLGVSLAAAFRVAPLATGALAVVSVVQMAALTATHPLVAVDTRIWERLLTKDAHPRTVLELVGITGWYRVLPFVALVAGALFAAAAVARPVSVRSRDVLVAAGATLLWLAVGRVSPEALEGAHGSQLRAIAFTAAVVAACAGLAWAANRGRTAPSS